MFYLFSDFQFALNFCKQMNKKKQYFYFVLGVGMKHQNKGKVTCLHLSMFGRFRSTQTHYGFDVAFNLSNFVNRIFLNSTILRLMYFGTLSIL